MIRSNPQVTPPRWLLWAWGIMAVVMIVISAYCQLATWAVCR